MRCTRSRACVRIFLLARLSSRLGDHDRYHAGRMSMRFTIKTLLGIVTLVAVSVASILAVQNQQRTARRDALKTLQSGGVLLLRSTAQENSIQSAEIWVTETRPGYFEINGSEYTEQNAKLQLLRLRSSLEHLRIERTLFVDNEPGSKNKRQSTVSLAYSSGFIRLGTQQTGKSKYQDRRKLFQAKKILY